MKSFMAFDDALLDRHPELKDFLIPTDQYPELNQFKKNRHNTLPLGSLNTKVIINNGKIVERIYKTPKGKVFSLFSQSSNFFLDVAA